MNNFNFAIQWHITSDCLNQCRHCYMYDQGNVKKENISFGNFKKIYMNIEDFCKKYDLLIQKYYLTGGAPQLNPDFEKIINFLANENKKIYIMDIPELVNDNCIKLLKKYNVRSFQMSLDGMEKTHDFFRGNGSFKRTIIACNLLADNGIEPHIMYTVSEHNIDEVLPLIEYLKKAVKRANFAFDFIVNEGNSKDLKTSIPVQKVKELLISYFNLAIKNNSENENIKLGMKPSIFNILGLYLDEDKAEYTQNYSVCAGCYNGWSSIAILPNGDVLPCRRLPIRIGNLLTDSFENIFLESPLLRKFRRYRSNFLECGQCEYGMLCRGCPAVSAGITGNPFDPYPFCFLNDEEKILHKVNNLKDAYNEPGMGCSKEEEMEFVLNSMANKIGNNIVDYLKNKNVMYGLQLLNKKENSDKFLFNSRRYAKEQGIDLKFDERYVLFQMLFEEVP